MRYIWIIGMGIQAEIYMDTKVEDTMTGGYMCEIYRDTRTGDTHIRYTETLYTCKVLIMEGDNY